MKAEAEDTVARPQGLSISDGSCTSCSVKKTTGRKMACQFDNQQIRLRKDKLGGSLDFCRPLRIQVGLSAVNYDMRHVHISEVSKQG